MLNKEFCVCQWMITDLELSGVRLLVYAVVYNYCKDNDDGVFSVSVRSLAKYLGTHVNSVSKALEYIVEQGILSKEECSSDGWKLPNKYRVVKRG